MQMDLFRRCDIMWEILCLHLAFLWAKDGNIRLPAISEWLIETYVKQILSTERAHITGEHHMCPPSQLKFNYSNLFPLKIEWRWSVTRSGTFSSHPGKAWESPWPLSINSPYIIYTCTHIHIYTYLDLPNHLNLLSITCFGKNTLLEERSH